LRRKAKIDSNQNSIVQFYRAYNCSVAITSALGGGFPDLVVAKNGRTILVEVKDGGLPPSKRKLTKDEQKFRMRWQGVYLIVENEIDVKKSLKYFNKE